jgi:Mce-associated membrane protein
MADDAANPDRELMESTTDGAAPERVDGARHSAPPAQRPIAVEWLALAASLIVVVLLVGLVGWLSVRADEARSAEAKRNLFVEVARQCAVNLSTVDYEDADADARRILDSATGNFYDNFSHRSKLFVDNVKQARSKSVGTVTDAGLESETGNEGRVLVAVTVQAANPGSGEQEPQFWRMRITVRKVGDGAKISNVAFVS